MGRRAQRGDVRVLTRLTFARADARTHERAMLRPPIATVTSETIELALRQGNDPDARTPRRIFHAAIAEHEFRALRARAHEIDGLKLAYSVKTSPRPEIIAFVRAMGFFAGVISATSLPSRVDSGCPDLPQAGTFEHRIFRSDREQIVALKPGNDRVSGSTCLEYDVLRRSISLRRPRDRGYALFADAGSYDSSMAFPFAHGERFVTGT